MAAKKIFYLLLSFIAIISAFYIISNLVYLASLSGAGEKAQDLQTKESGERSKADEDAKDVPYYIDMAIEKIYLNSDDAVYSLKNGKIYEDGHELGWDKDSEKINRVLRLALFYQWEKEDPLFFSSTLNLESFQRSTDLLKNTQGGFLKKFNLQSNVFAVDFLQKYIDASKSYRELLGNVSEKNAGILIQNIEETNSTYFDEAESLEKKIESLKAGDPLANKKYFLLGRETSTDSNIILDDLNKIKENSVFAGKEIGQRKRCLYDSWKSCMRPLEKFAKPGKVSDPKDDVPVFLTKEELNLADNINYLGPYEVNSPCWQGKNINYLYVSKECKDGSAHCTESFRLATDVYFEKLSEKVPFQKYLIDKGLAIMPQVSANSYTCTNLEYQPKLATINYFYNEFKDKHFYQNIKKLENFNKLPVEFKDVIIEGVAAEDIFFDAKFPSEDSLENLADFYRFTYSYSIENNLLNEQDKEELLHRYLTIKEKMPDLDLLINRVNDLFSGYSQKMDSNKTLFSQGYVYMARSVYSLSFLNFSSSVWRSDDSPQYLTRNTDMRSTDRSITNGIIDYQTAISKYGKEKISSWIKIYNQSADKRSDGSLENK